ncbi:MAG: hypothetical protein ACOY81_02040 [Bacillota bacterium]
MMAKNHDLLLAVLGGIFLGLILLGVTLVYCRLMDLLPVQKGLDSFSAAHWQRLWQNMPGWTDWQNHARKLW